MSLFNEVFKYQGEDITQEQIKEIQKGGKVEGRINLDEQKKSLKFEIKNVYGRYLYYPFCERSEKLIKIFQDNRKSFTEDQIKVLHDSGFRVLLSIPRVKGEIVFNPDD